MNRYTHYYNNHNFYWIVLALFYNKEEVFKEKQRKLN